MSTINIYQVDFTPETNACVENIQDYLATLTAKYTSEIQYQKIGLNMSIDIGAEQSKVGTAIGNFADLYQDEKHFYFFIMGATWLSKQAVRLSLSLDTVNTFSGDFTFNDKTHVIREHKSRFRNTTALVAGNNNLYEIVDDVDEGLSGAIQYKVSDNKITQSDTRLNQKWYLVYKSAETPTTNSPIDIRLVPATKVPLRYESNAITLQDTYFERGFFYYFLRYDNSTSTTFTYDSNTYQLSGNTVGIALFRANTDAGELGIWRLYTNDNYRTVITANIATNIGSITINNSLGYRRKLTGTEEITADTARIQNEFSFTSLVSSSTSHMAYSSTISDIDRTDSKNIKIIELPYCPVALSWTSTGIALPTGWEISEDYFLKPTAVSAELGQTIKTDIDLGLVQSFTVTAAQLPLIAFLQNGQVTDPKLKHSSLYTYKLVYDNYALPIQFEKLTATGTATLPAYDIYFKPANTITSNLGFRVDFDNCTYTSSNDYGNYVIATRNNESPIYTNAYIDYLRNGYNFDRKAQTISKVNTYINAAVSLTGSAVSLAKGIMSGGLSLIAGVSMAGSAITTLSNAISSVALTENSIQQKLVEARNQSTTVGGSDDLDLLNWYNENKLHIMIYQVSDKMRALMGKTFYYCGYAQESYKVPTHNNRIWFDYLQCEPVFDEEYTTIYQDYLTDIKSRFSAGVTYFHKYKNHWNFDRTYENWEAVLL